MAKIIKYDKPKMQAIIDTLRASAKQMRDSMHQMDALGTSLLQDEKLLGPSGEAMSKAIKGNLCRSMDRLATKLEERASFVERELQQMEAASEK